MNKITASAGKSLKNTPEKKQVVTVPPVEKKDNFTEELYAQITKIFASKNPTQMFCLCWPGTVLDYERLRWDPADAVAGNMPEQALIRSSQLLDLYIPPAPITQPDGTRVSDRYRQAIRQFAPLPQRDLMRLQQVLRARLQREVTVEVNGQKKTMRLIDWFSHLYMEWVRAKQAWGNVQQEEMTRLRAKYIDNPDLWWSQYLVWFQNNAEAYILRINMAYDTMITEFPLPEWEDAIAILDTAGNSALSEAKRLLSATNIPVPNQEGMRYAPTTGIPYDWPLHLKPSTKYVDLLADPETQQNAVENAITALRQEIMTWYAIIPQVDSDLVKESLKVFDEAFADYHQKQTDILKQVSQNTFQAVQMFCDIMESRQKKIKDIPDGSDEQKNVENEIKDIRDQLNVSNPAGKEPSSDIDWAMIKEMAGEISESNDALIEKQQALVKAGRDLGSNALRYLEAAGSQSSFNWLESYVHQLETKLDALVKKATNLRSASNKYYDLLNTPGNPDISQDKKVPSASTDAFGKDAFPSPLDAPENARWTLVTASLDSQQLKSNKKLNTYYNASQWGVDFFLGSGGGTSEVNGSKFAEEFLTQNGHVEIGFLATKVLIERPWMRPEVLGQSKNFFRTGHQPLSPPSQLTEQQLMGEANEGNLRKVLQDYAFPAYPVAVLLAKDITVKIKIDTAQTARAKEMAKAIKSESGGFLLFNYSKTEASESNDESMNSYCMAGQMVARVAAPQIIGYWVQFLPPDLSSPLDQQVATEIADALSFVTNLAQAHNTPRVTLKPPQRPQ